MMVGTAPMALQVRRGERGEELPHEDGHAAYEHHDPEQSGEGFSDLRRSPSRLA